jgi:hypothetical protein
MAARLRLSGAVGGGTRQRARAIMGQRTAEQARGGVATRRDRRTMGAASMGTCPHSRELELGWG